MTEQDDSTQTYHPEYANLPTKETGIFGPPAPRCPKCEAWGETEVKIATEDGDKYRLWGVWGCPDCGHYWKCAERPFQALFRHRVSKDPGIYGHEVVGHE